MALGRRALLLGLLAAPAWGAEPLRRVLFIGNSFTFEHDVPARVAALAAADGRPIETHMIARGGARLALHWARPEVRETVSWGWEAVVLQDHSTEALYADRAAAGRRAVRQIAEAAQPAALVLVAPWARAPGHQLYRLEPRLGYAGPRTPAEMMRLTMAHTRALAEATGATLAPVAAAWEAALAKGRRLHREDGYHAAPAGAELTAAVIWAALAPRLP